jgi:mono/diheme cytochrome c family protein
MTLMELRTLFRYAVSGLGVAVLLLPECAVADAELQKVSVQLPTSAAAFPAGEGADVANEQCLICHSAGMVLQQPQRTEAQWKAAIAKMRDAYGAPLPVQQIEPLAAYLTRVVAVDTGGEQVSSGPQSKAGSSAADGASVFTRNCVVCHQAAGTGIPGAFPPLAGSTWVNGRGTVLIQVVLHGLQGSVPVGTATYNGAMPGFASQLSDAEIASVLTYIRGQWGNKGGSVDASVVKAQRAATAARGSPWNGEADLNSLK